MLLMIIAEKWNRRKGRWNFISPCGSYQIYGSGMGNS